MSENWSPLGQVRVRLYNGTLHTYISIDAAVRDTPWNILQSRAQDGSFDIYRGVWPVHTYGYVKPSRRIHGACELRDQHGLLIPECLIADAIGRTGAAYYPYRYCRSTRPQYRTAYRRPEGGHKRSETVCEAAWRRTPPRTHGRKTMGAHKALGALRDDEDLFEMNIHVKARRGYAFDTWDDHNRSDWNSKSWKRNRAHQYRERPSGRS